MASTKLVCIKQKSPTLPTKYPRGTQSFGKAGDFYSKIFVMPFNR